MKTSFIQTFCMIVLAMISIFDAKSQDKSGQALASIKEKVKEVQVDKTSYKQSLDILDESKGKLSFVSVSVDEKGKTAKEAFEFFVSDIDKNTIIRKTSGKKLFISLSISNGQKFIKHFSEDKLEGYTSTLEILLSNADEAQELVNLFKSVIPLVNSSAKGWSTNTDALNWLKSSISKVSSGTVTYEQSFSFGERKPYLVGFTVKKSDQKGASTEGKYEFNILDINKKNLVVKVSGTQLSVSVETTGKDPYIKYIKDNEQQNFANDFEIIAEDIDQARNIIAAFSTAIDKSKADTPDFSSLQKALDFITKNTIDLTLDKKTVSQKISFSTGGGTKTVFTFAEPDSKGKSIEERYELYLSDIDVNSLNFKVSGRKITVVSISKNKTKFVRYYKDNTPQDFQNEIGILVADIETSREMAEAFKVAIKSSETQPTAWKNTAEAIAYLTGTLKGETLGTDIYILNLSALTTDPLYLSYVQGKTDAKGLTTEQSFEFYPYMLDPGTIKIESSGKYLSVEVSVTGKKPYIKALKEGKQQAYREDVGLIAFDSKQAQEIAGAIKYLASNTKPKEIVWADKQSALKYITDNVGDMKNEGNEVKQKIELTDNDPCKISFSVSSTDDKGKTTEGMYEFGLADMNKQLADLKVSGKNVEVTLPCKNKEKLIKVYKNGEQQAWGTDVKIGVSDIEIARNIVEAFKSAITQCAK